MNTRSGKLSTTRRISIDVKTRRRLWQTLLYPLRDWYVVMTSSVNDRREGQRVTRRHH